MVNLTTDYKTNPIFTRNTFPMSGSEGFALIKKQEIDLTNQKFITYADTKHNDTKHKDCGVLFFVDDYKFYNIGFQPKRTFKKLSQYPVLCTPEYSMFADLPIWVQKQHIGLNRWVGAYWQSRGLKVIPSINWGLAQSFEFCFQGVEKDSIVAVGMIGCKMDKISFMRGYNEMLNQIKPEIILCYGTPFKEMKGNIITADYWRRGNLKSNNKGGQ